MQKRLEGERRVIREEDLRCCAWVDDKKRIVSFHKIPGARLFCENEAGFWEKVVALVLDGYRVQ